MGEQSTAEEPTSGAAEAPVTMEAPPAHPGGRPGAPADHPGGRPGAPADHPGGRPGAPADMPGSAAATPAGPQGFVPGGTLGGYKIERFVAEGGMGEVYLALETFSRRKVAIKRVKTDLQGRPDLSERLQIEARILAELNHPCIVAMLFSGEYEGRGYIVMEWLEGKTLREFMNHRGKPLDLPTALYYAILIAGALRAAHKVGILHRDLKPENIFLLQGGKLKVLDFGLGKLNQSIHANTTDRLVQMATVYYAAPEQFGRHGLDERTDVYALALIFLEMATGRHAFSDLPGVLPLKEIVQANQMFAAPNSLRALVPSCPESLAALIDRALAKDQTQRPTTEEFLAALRRERSALLAAKPATVTAPPDEEDNVDEPAPEPPREGESGATGAARGARMAQLKTEPLADDFQPQDPSAATPVYTFVPVRHTIKLPDAPADPASAMEGTPEQPGYALTPLPTPPGGSDVSSSTDGAGETTGAGRMATLPPAEAAGPQSRRGPLSGPLATPAPAAPPGPAPVRGASSPAPVRAAPVADGELRQSVEFANRPTLPWRRKQDTRARGAAFSPTPAPTHQSALNTASAPPARTSIPLWAGPAVGVLMTLGAFAIFIGLRTRARDPVVQAARASVSAEPSGGPMVTAVASADIAPPRATAVTSVNIAPPETSGALPAASSTPTMTASAPPQPAKAPLPPASSSEASPKKRTDPRPTATPSRTSPPLFQIPLDSSTHHR